LKDRRSNYRVQQRASGLRVSLEADGKTWDGIVADTSAGGIAASYPVDAAPQLALGDCIELFFQGGGIDEGRRAHVWVKSVDDTGAHRRYGFSFTDPGKAVAGIPFAHRENFNRRAWLRVLPDRAVNAVLVPLEGDLHGREIEAGVADISAGGMALFVSGIRPEGLREVTAVRCTAIFPGESVPRTLTGRIRNREHLTHCVRVGVAFDPDDDGDRGPTYERSWDCESCEHRGLLATSHLRCPACCHPRGDGETYLLAWSAIQPQSAHEFWGNQSCTTCEAKMSSKAAYCGRCGTSLV